VYSLGVILYELLTSQRPYQIPSGSIAEMVRVVCEQPPVPLTRAAIPERLRRRLSGDLEKIAGKALEKDPRQRYASVDGLAADVRRHLAGLPVRARPATFTYRAGKLLRRHRVAIPAGALAAILILTFAGVAWWEAVRAQRRFDQVRNLAHSVMFDLHDAILPLAGSTAARQILVSNALQYLEQLSRESSGDKRLAREIALGYERIGLVQGYVSEANLGQTRASLASLRKAEDMLDRLSAATSSNRGLRQDYVRVSGELASALNANGDFKSAVPLVERCIAIADADVRAHPSDLSALRVLATANYELADTLTNQGRYADAIPVRQQVLGLFQRVADADPSSVESARSLALAHKKLAALYGVTQRYQEGLAEYEQARVIDERRLGLNPAGARTKLDLSYDYSDLGWITSRLQNDAAALEWHRKALALRLDAAKADPNDARAARSVASSTGRMASVLRRLGRLDEALSSSKDGLEAWRRISEKSSGDVAAVTEVADAHADIAQVEIDMAALKTTPASKGRELRAAAAQEYEAGSSLYAGLRDRGKLAKAEEHHIDEYAARAAKLRAQK